MTTTLRDILAESSVYSKSPLSADAIFASQLCVTVWRKRVNKDVRRKSGGPGKLREPLRPRAPHRPEDTNTIKTAKCIRAQSLAADQVLKSVCTAFQSQKTQQVTARHTSLCVVTLQKEKKKHEQLSQIFIKPPSVL